MDDAARLKQSIPRSQPETVPDAEQGAEERQKTGATNKMLLVDDNNINLKVLSARMGKLDRSYEMAVNGQEAVDIYTKSPEGFSGILMDISMPVMDEFEATRQIRKFERHHGLPATPIVALTGLASHEAQQEALESGVDLFLTKPVKLNVLSEALESLKI